MPYEQIGKNEPVCIADEVPFDIPDSWEWVRLQDIVSKDIKRGKSPKYAVSSSVFVFAQKCNVKNGGINLSLSKCLDLEHFKKYSETEYMLDGDIVVNSTGGGTLGRIGIFHDSDRINNNIIVPDSHVTIVRLNKLLNNSYVYYVMKYYQNYLEKLGEGSTNQTELKPLTIAQLFIPIPSIKEQELIVEKLNIALPYVEQYNFKKDTLDEYNNTFSVRLKKSILQDAVMGKLVPQDENDESASVLLERIREEKQRLIAEGKIKKDKNESIIFRRDNSHYEKLNGIERCIDGEIPFDIPQNWEWTRLKNICNVVSARRVHQSDWCNKGIPFYRAREIAKLSDNGYVNNDLFISEDLYNSLSISGVPKSGDLMVTAVGTLGKTYIVKENDRFYYKDASVVCFENFGRLCPEFLQAIMNSPYLIDLVKSKSSGTTVDTITIIKAKEYLFPIPPLNEQYRIVEQLNKVIPQCEKL